MGKLSETDEKVLKSIHRFWVGDRDAGKSERLLARIERYLKNRGKR